MQKIFLVTGMAIFLFGCGNSNMQKKKSAPATDSSKADSARAMYFGDKINEDGAIALADMKMGDKKEMKVKLTGEVEAVCQKKGCWMDLKNPNGESMRVTFKDYAFFMPKDCAGKTAIVEGVASVEETSVADQKEYAKDAGKSKEEITAIKEPKKELVFEASGVILK